MLRLGGKSARSAVSTWRPLASAGSTWASTVVKSMEKNGMPNAIRMVVAAIATRSGRRCTKRESRYQNPASSDRASRSAAR